MYKRQERVCDYVVVLFSSQVQLSGDVNDLLGSHLRLSGVRRDPGSLPADWVVVEETHTGHELVQVFGRSEATIDEFSRQNKRLYEASFKAQFLSGIIQPSMQFIANLNYVTCLLYTSRCV